MISRVFWTFLGCKTMLHSLTSMYEGLQEHTINILSNYKKVVCPPVNPKFRFLLYQITCFTYFINIMFAGSQLQGHDNMIIFFLLSKSIQSCV